MADDRKEYVVTIGGLSHTLLLDESDAQRYGDAAQAKKAVEPKAVKPADKARTAPNKSK